MREVCLPRGDGGWVVRQVCRAPQELLGQWFSEAESPFSTEAARTGQVVAVSDARSDPRADPEQAMQYGLRAALVIPLTGGEGEATWVLRLNHYTQARQFTPAEIDFARRLGALLSLAAEKARLADAETRQRALLEQLIAASPTAIAVLEGPEYRYALADPTYQAVTGLSEQQLLGRTVAEALPWGKDDIYPLLDRTYGQGEVVPLNEFQVSLGPGQETHWNGAYVPLRGRGGEVEAILVTVNEVTGYVLTAAPAGGGA